jgi:superfamily II DNA or RNA helicase
VQSHPKKFEIAKKILEARKDSKCITFSSTIKDSESFKSGYVLHSKQSKKKNKEVLEAFNKETSGVLHTSRAAEAGMDLKGINTEIILYNNSSKIRHQQVVGRAIRFEPGKIAEIFTLVIKGTMEVTWVNNSMVNSNHIVINEQQLDQVLAGEEIITRERENVEDKKYKF